MECDREWHAASELCLKGEGGKTAEEKEDEHDPDSLKHKGRKKPVRAETREGKALSERLCGERGKKK